MQHEITFIDFLYVSSLFSEVQQGFSTEKRYKTKKVKKIS